jgi:hypothetical protein
MVPSLFLCVRVTERVKASLSAALSGQGRVTCGPARKRLIGAVPISACRRLLYSCSTQAWVASLRKARLRSLTCSSMAMRRPSTGPQKASCLAF